MINTWNESLLHEELKEYFSGDSGVTEVPVEGSICDAVLDDGSIVEIQTKNLGKLRAKLEKLLQSRRVTLVYPIARNTLIETYEPSGILKTRRKSPKHGTIFQLFEELTGIWHLVGHPGFTVTAIFTDTLELRIADGTGSWRRKGIRISDRKLVKMHETVEIRTLEDLSAIVPNEVPEVFTVSDLSRFGAGAHAGKMAWVLGKTGIAERIGKSGRSYTYRLKIPNKRLT